MTNLIEGFRLALGTLTILPSGPVTPTRASARVMVAVAPLAVLPLAAGTAVVGLLAGLIGSPALVTGLLIVGGLALGTRAMHLDGVADVADGIGGGWDPARARAILKRGDVGPMGTVALIVLIGLQASSAAAILGQDFGWLVIGLVVAVSRGFLALPCSLPAMPGSTLGAVLAGSVLRAHAVIGTVITVGVLSLVVWGLGWPAWGGIIAGSVAALVVWAVTARARRAFGGVNGDVMGATIEVAFTTILVVLAWR